VKKMSQNEFFYGNVIRILLQLYILLLHITGLSSLHLETNLWVTLFAAFSFKF